MSRIVIHESGETHHLRECLPATPGVHTVSCADRESLVAALADRAPDVLVYVLENLPEDLRLLRALRGLAPTLPMILLGGPADLETRRAFQEVKPTYYGIFPLEGSELSDAVTGALHLRR